MAPITCLTILAAAGCGQQDLATRCSGAGACVALQISSADLGAVTLDRMEVIIHAGSTHRRLSFQDRVITLPASVAVELPELDAHPAEPVSLYVRAGYDGTAGRSTSLAASLAPLSVSAGLDPDLPLPLKVVCDAASCPAPGPRQLAAMAFDPGLRRTVLFGGYGPDALGTPIALSDTWEWDGSAWSAVNTSPSPPQRAGHVLAYDPQRGHLILFGGDASPGGTKPTLLGDTWEYLGSAVGWSPLGVTGPAPRRLAALSTAPVGGQSGLLLFGGQSSSGLLSDTWVWRGAAATWTQQLQYQGPCGAAVSMPDSAPRCRLGAALSQVQWPGLGPVALLVGGQTGVSALNTPLFDSLVWRWDGASWSQALVDDPPAAVQRLSPQLVPAADAPQSQLLLVGGETDGQLHGDAFVLDLTTDLFVPQLGAGPSGRTAPAATYDQERGEAVLFGGWDGTGDLADTWTFVPAQGWSAGQ